MQETNVYTNLYQTAEQFHEELCALAEDLNACPELGFREYKTSARLLRAFQTLPLEFETFAPLTGFCATLDTGTPGPTVAVLCELDALPCPDHPNADPETGAAHCCGHHVQMAAAYGSAKALVCSGIFPLLCGRIKFMAVPAEEYVDLDFRCELRRKGMVQFLGGKSELIARGAFDGVDAAVAIHSLPSTDWRFALCTGLNGFQAVIIDIYGKGGHSATNPVDSVNALDAAQLGISALNAWRATFRESDAIRVNPIITKGGDAMNVVPGHVRVEMLIRGNSKDAIDSTMKKTEMAFQGAAQALGARAKITSLHGYFPFQASKKMNWLAESVARNITGKQVAQLPPGYSASDLGDLSMCIPVVQPYLSGCSGSLHAADFRVTDDTCYTDGAKLLSGIVADLLVDSGTFVKRLKQKEPPHFPTKESYVEAAERFFSAASITTGG